MISPGEHDRLRRVKWATWRMLHAGCGILLLAAAVYGQTLSLRVDLAKTSAVSVRHPTLLAAQGYGVHYLFEVPGEQVAAFHRATPQAEFEEIVVETAGGDIDEVRTSKSGEPSALVIRRGSAGLVAFWDLSATEKIPPPPSEAEVRRRFTHATDLFAAAQLTLGLKDFKGGEAGTLTLQLAGVEDLRLRSRGDAVLYDYTFFAFAQENMVEELKAEESAATLTIEVGSGRVLVRREVTPPDGQRIISEVTIQSNSWEAFEEIRRPGDRPVRRELTRTAAERLLAEGLSQMRIARSYFGIPFGRDLTAYRMP